MLRDLTTRIDEHFGKDKKSHIYQHLTPSDDCLNACSSDCFSVLNLKEQSISYAEREVCLLVG